MRRALRRVAWAARFLAFPSVRATWATENGACPICLRPLPIGVECDACAPLRVSR